MVSQMKELPPKKAGGSIRPMHGSQVEHLNTKAFPFMRLGRNRHTGAVAKMFELFAPVQLSWRKAVAGFGTGGKELPISKVVG